MLPEGDWSMGLVKHEKCEYFKHEGDPHENHGKGTWLLKLPECIYMCPNCNNEWFIERYRKIKAEEFQKSFPKDGGCRVLDLNSSK